ncbi:MAG: hypothetical protein GY931_07205 [Maribacter sp.]|nr:hypothetical protein [Maribacter sp.]
MKVTKILFRNPIFLVFGTLSISFIFIVSVFSQTAPSIRILEIEQDWQIIGSIAELESSEYEQYKVLVYVKTDRWYIHPYQRGGPGKSYASINNDGTWSIRTVKRTFSAEIVAALLVTQDYDPPAITRSLGVIDFIAKDMVSGDGNYKFKLGDLQDE